VGGNSRYLTVALGYLAILLARDRAGQESADAASEALGSPPLWWAFCLARIPRSAPLCRELISGTDLPVVETLQGAAVVGRELQDHSAASGSSRTSPVTFSSPTRASWSPSV
jgi:hypothetical protein